jgi:general secretion pathway protein A
VEILGPENTGRRWNKKWLYAVALGLIILLATLIYALQPSAPDPLVTDSSAQAAAVPLDAAVADLNSPPTNPFVALFDIWSVQAGELYSQEEFFNLAGSYGLRAERVNSGDITDLQRVNRPGIVRLKDEAGFLKSYLVTEITQTSVVVRKGTDSQMISLQDFTARWSGSFVYLWRPPQQIDALKLGDTNPQALDWLQARLAAVDANGEIIISGGRYTQAIADQVLAFQRQQNIRADGVVGRETLLRLNQLTDNSIPRLGGLD